VRYVGALLLGGVVALAAVAVHRVDVRGLPVGLVLAVAASVATAWQLRRSAVPRTTAAYCLGWVAVVGVTLAGKPEGTSRWPAPWISISATPSPGSA